MKEWDRLTESDAKEALSTRFWSSAEAKAAYIERVTEEVAEFWECEELLGVRWMAMGLTTLSEGQYNNWKEKVGTGPATRAELRGHFQAAAAKAKAEHVQELREDPDYRARLAAMKPAPDPEDHPWGAEALFACERWLEASPYTHWQFLLSVEAAATVWAEDHAIELVRGTYGGKPVGDIVSAEYHKRLLALEEGYEELRLRQLQARADDLTVAESWDEWPLGAP